MREIIEHTISPVYDTHSRILLLGTMPSPKSREQGFFYAHPQNRFWPVLSELFHTDIPKSNAGRTDFLLQHRIALWDVLQSCSIEGASDSSIQDALPNDLSRIVKYADIQAVFTTGAKAAALYRTYHQEKINLPLIPLPSTSAANRGRFPMEKLLEAYQVIFKYL